MIDRLLMLRLAATGGAALTTAIFSWAIAIAPSRSASRLGQRGLKRQRALESALFALFEPLVRWLGARFSGLLPDGLYERIDRQLVLAGDYLGLTPEEYIACCILGGIGGVACGSLTMTADGSAATVIVLGVSGALGTYMRVARTADARSRQINKGLPYVIDLLALAMSAGLDFPGAVRQVVARSSNREDALTEELERILQELSLGHTRRQALENFAERSGVVAVQEFVAAVVQSEQRGNPLSETLVIQAQVSRQRRSMRAEAAAARSATLVYLPLGLAMVSVLLLVGGPLFMKMQTVLGK